MNGALILQTSRHAKCVGNHRLLSVSSLNLSSNVCVNEAKYVPQFQMNFPFEMVVKTETEFPYFAPIRIGFSSAYRVNAASSMNN